MIASRLKKDVQQQIQAYDSKQNIQLRYHLGKIVAELPGNTSASLNSKAGDQPVIVCQGTDNDTVKSKRLYEWMTTAVKQRKVAILITCIVATAGVCWFGASTIYVMSWFCPSCGVRGTWLHLLHPWLLYLNSAINPVLLIIMSDDFRKAFRSICSCCRKKDQTLSPALSQCPTKRTSRLSNPRS